MTQAALLAPMFFFAPAILARAGLYTVGIMGSIAIVGATAKQDKYLYLGGPLLGAVALVAISGLAPLVLPATAVRALAWSENIWLYGGLAVSMGFTLYHVQSILHHARLAQRGLIPKDTVNEKVSAASDKADSMKSGGSKNDSVVDLGTGTGANTGATAPMAGASASRTAPDVTRP